MKRALLSVFFILGLTIMAMAQAEPGKKNDAAAADESMKTKKSKEEIKYGKKQKKIHDAKQKKIDATRKKTERTARKRLNKAKGSASKKKRNYVKTHNK
jgi:hypothetical protein